MEKEENKVNFDLSLLSLDELITLYEEISGFLNTLNGMLDKEGGNNE